MDTSPPQLAEEPRYANYLPDELLLAILDYFPPGTESQPTLHSFCLVNRQWYNLGVSRLYESPRLTGAAYSLFVRTVCPSINAHIRKSELANLVRELSLENIVHQSTKSITARLLGRTKHSLEKFVAPQASFGPNCWAALSKCKRLKYLDLTLVSEAIAYQALMHTVQTLPELTDLYFPRCSHSYDTDQISLSVGWPPKLERLRLAGGVHGRFMADVHAQVKSFPPTLTHFAITHCPRIGGPEVLPLLFSLGRQLLWVELTDLPHVRQGHLNTVLTCCPKLRELRLAIDYVDMDFGNMPVGFNPSMIDEGHPLETLVIMACGRHHPEDGMYCTPADIFDMVDKRYLARLRRIYVASETGWYSNDDWNEELGGLKDALVELDEENFNSRRFRYATIGTHWTYTTWKECNTGRRWLPAVWVVNDAGTPVAKL